MLIPNTCLNLAPISSIFLALTLYTAGAPNASLQPPNTIGDRVASDVVQVPVAFKPSQSLHSSVAAKSSYTTSNDTSLPRSSQSTQSSVSAKPSYTAANDTSLPISSQSAQSSGVSSVSNTAADRLASIVVGVADVSRESASSNIFSASSDATNSAQPIPITNSPPASTSSPSSVQSLGLNGTLTPLPNVATVILDGKSQVIYKQTFTNLQNITAAENITTALTQYNSQSTSNAIPPVVAPVAIVVGAAGIWYRIGTIGPPIGPPELPRLTVGGGKSLCELFPLFCPGKTPLSPPPVPPRPQNIPDSPNNVQNPPNPTDDSDSESEKASQSRGEPTNMLSSTQTPTTKATYSAQSQTTRSISSTWNSKTRSASSAQISTTKATYSAQSQTTRSMSSTQNSTTRSVSSTQTLIAFNWVTETPSADPVFLTTSENFSAMASYFQAQFTSMGIAFDQEDAMAGVGPMNATNATTTFASSEGKETDVPATATNGADVAAAVARISDALAGVIGLNLLMASMSSTAGLASTSAAALVANTVSAAANEPPSSSPTPPVPTAPPSTGSPIILLACTQM